VNSTDLTLLLANYQTYSTTYDISGNGYVDSEDLTILLANYQKTQE
jgi:hypothetical protein